MPNWCECDLTIIGPRDRVAEFLEFAKGKDSAFDFERFIPYPVEFQRMDDAARAWDVENCGKPDCDFRNRPKDGFNSGGYQWCTQNWGTKWPARRICNDPPQVWRVESGVTSAGIQFETAWSPPCPVILKAAELFPDLELDLRYFECGMQFNGAFICRKGKVVLHESGRYYGRRGG